MFARNTRNLFKKEQIVLGGYGNTILRTCILNDITSGNSRSPEWITILEGNSLEKGVRDLYDCLYRMPEKAVGS